jgi:hypothetical protein
VSGGGASRPLLGLYLFLVALWTGALLAFAGGAGLVLRAAPTRADGGVVNRALLDALDVASLALSGLLLALAFVLNRTRPWSRTARGFSLRLLAVAAVAAFVSLYLVTPEMVALRAKAGGAFDLLPATDPLRRAWGRLHGLSLLTLLVRLVCAAAAFGLAFGQLPAGPAREVPPPGDSS